VDLITIHISEMTRGDKVTVFLCLVTSCLFASIITVLKKFDNPSVWYIDAIINFFQAIVIAAIFSIIDRIGTLIPVEKRLGEIYQAINKNAELAKQEHINSNKSLVDSIDRLADYSNYQNAKNNYGFNSIQGIELVQDLRIGGISTQSKNLALNIIRNAEFGDKISYMTTFLGEESVYIKSIREAVYRGVKIKLLLMMPSLHAPVIQSRFYDVSDITHRVPRENFAEKDKQIKMFLSLLQAKADIILELRDELQKNSGKNNGSFEVLFYTKSLNFPLIHIERPTINGISNIISYTGFYGGNNAEEMPYIEWSGGIFQICRKFQTLFDGKWSACSEHRGYKAYELQESNNDAKK
jgi:hypothetical protein